MSRANTPAGGPDRLLVGDLGLEVNQRLEPLKSRSSIEQRPNYDPALPRASCAARASFAFKPRFRAACRLLCACAVWPAAR